MCPDRLISVPAARKRGWSHEITGSSNADIRSQQSQQPAETIKSSGQFILSSIFCISPFTFSNENRGKVSVIAQFSGLIFMSFISEVYRSARATYTRRRQTIAKNTVQPPTPDSKLRARAPGLCMPPIWCCAIERIMEARILGAQPRPAWPCHVRRAMCAVPCALCTRIGHAKVCTSM